MRPERLMNFVTETLDKAPGVQARPWQDGTNRPYGVHARFASGSELRLGVMVTTPPGEDHSKPEIPVTGEPPTETTSPDPLGKTFDPTAAEQYIAAILTNSGNNEIKNVYGYSSRATPTSPTAHPGVGLEFHSTGKGYLLFL
ncbi:hypothetical protein OG301_39220 (plasmid) [Streptomyces platensis]|uniref:hypothetical protein n=1 Tax=Streptomyces platensis TaxID=58346 RepID=UPI002ED4B59B|nr:hypothetical protein OG301_39220 [Streptomyces platensis]